MKGIILLAYLEASYVTCTQNAEDTYISSPIPRGNDLPLICGSWSVKTSSLPSIDAGCLLSEPTCSMYGSLSAERDAGMRVTDYHGHLY